MSIHCLRSSRKRLAEIRRDLLRLGLDFRPIGIRYLQGFGIARPGRVISHMSQHPHPVAAKGQPATFLRQPPAFVVEW
jgi:hypothetical protein